MKALTIWQPWASLITIGAKPIEWRPWDYRTRGILPGTRIVIHAGARAIKPQEIADLLDQVRAGESSLIAEKAEPLLVRLLSAHKCRGIIPMSCALGTAVLEMPKQVDRLFKYPDSDRTTSNMWGWPLTNVTTFDEPIPMRGAQGFWNCQIKEAA